jgi:hypothetical protein
MLAWSAMSVTVKVVIVVCVVIAVAGIAVGIAAGLGAFKSSSSSPSTATATATTTPTPTVVPPKLCTQLGVPSLLDTRLFPSVTPANFTGVTLDTDTLEDYILIQYTIEDKANKQGQQIAIFNSDTLIYDVFDEFKYEPVGECTTSFAISPAAVSTDGKYVMLTSTLATPAQYVVEVYGVDFAARNFQESHFVLTIDSPIDDKTVPFVGYTRADLVDPTIFYVTVTNPVDQTTAIDFKGYVQSFQVVANELKILQTIDMPSPVGVFGLFGLFVTVGNTAMGIGGTRAIEPTSRGIYYLYSRSAETPTLWVDPVEIVPPTAGQLLPEVVTNVDANFGFGSGMTEDELMLFVSAYPTLSDSKQYSAIYVYSRSSTTDSFVFNKAIFSAFNTTTPVADLLVFKNNYFFFNYKDTVSQIKTQGYLAYAIDTSAGTVTAQTNLNVVVESPPGVDTGYNSQIPIVGRMGTTDFVSLIFSVGNYDNSPDWDTFLNQFVFPCTV